MNFENNHLIVHFLSFSLLKAHRDLICKIHQAILSSAGRTGYVKLVQEPLSVYPYTAMPCTNSEITNDMHCHRQRGLAQGLGNLRGPKGSC